MTLDERFSRARTELQEMITETEVPPATNIRRRHVRRRAVQGIAGVAAAAVIVFGTMAVLSDNDKDDNSGVVVTTPTTEGLLGNWIVVPDSARRGPVAPVQPWMSFGPATGLCGTPPYSSDLGNGRALEGTCTSIETFDGCNRGSGFARIDDSSFEIGELVSTTLGCQWLLDVPDGGTYEVDGDRLVIEAPDGRTIRLDRTAGEPTTTTSLPTTATATSEVETFVSFPSERTDLTHGGKTWALVLAGGATYESPEVAEAINQASSAGYSPGVGDCDVGAAEAIGFQSTDTSLIVDIYFNNEADAQQASAAFAAGGQNPGVVAEVETFCLD